ncbi:MAG: DapH/DapD/GlmU-related protein [Promethearchaeota archaeon]|jgi:UDP-3-O-[3-hydroxymyristoyl] glucosamine N-acyltransferase
MESERLKFIRELQKREIKPPIIKMGENCIICENVVLGNDGLGFEPDENGDLVFFPHFGNVIIGNNVRVGSGSCIDRGNMSDTIIGDNVKIDNLVHIAHNVQIDKNTIVVAGAVVCGSVKIGKNCFIGANSTIREHLTIGDNVLIGMGSVVTKNIPNDEVWAGNPAKFLKKIK